MATNPYFNNYSQDYEQDLYDDIVIESIQIKGLDVKYIQRTQENIDFLYNQDSSAYYKIAKTIEMWPAFVDGFEGMEGMSFFGNEFEKSGTFVLSKTRFKEEFPNQERPSEGDLIFMPVTNAILEIKYVDTESPFFEKGKQYVYELKVQTFGYSYESIENQEELSDYSDEDIDLQDVLDKINMDEDRGYGTNEEFQEEVEESINWSPNNPFGVGR